ncbi:MAG: energy transducer TonB [Prevotellaceae bacterium]|jgi:TonB family protein|nr:energy transducer TonB [Prevotellaceae bacterium]
MAQRIKFNIIQSLFHLFSFLADKTNGWAMFVKPKILLGSVILGLSATTVFAEKPTNIPTDTLKEINRESYTMCYEITVQGGMEELYNYIGKNLKYPASMVKDSIQGKVICQFTVEEDGSIGDVKVIKSTVPPEGEAEAIRVIESMPKWIPGKHNGNKVRVSYILPINFKLQ